MQALILHDLIVMISTITPFQDTARTPKYTILPDDNNVKLAQVESICYHLCYGHKSSTYRLRLRLLSTSLIDILSVDASSTSSSCKFWLLLFILIAMVTLQDAFG
uniref:Piwi domain-containing protein n=1 Tax=Ditylenchus dipsaci TaxID=166011 RepID=A0A915ENJ7_9BILA